MKYKINGAIRDTGKDVELEIDAASEQEVQQITTRLGILVSKVTPLPPPSPTASPRQRTNKPTTQDDSKSRVVLISLILACLLIIGIITGALLLNPNETNLALQDGGSASDEDNVSIESDSGPENSRGEEQGQPRRTPGSDEYSDTEFFELPIDPTHPSYEKPDDDDPATTTPKKPNEIDGNSDEHDPVIEIVESPEPEPWGDDSAPEDITREDLSQAQIAKGIQAIIDFLYSSQDNPSGGWYGAYHSLDKPADEKNKNEWGPSAMVAMALIYAGESPEKPELAKAIDLLAGVELYGTYALSMRTQLWSKLEGDRFRKLTLEDGRRLGNSTNLGRFGYDIYGTPNYYNRHTRIDNSTTQYGVIALWNADGKGIKVPEFFWTHVRDHFLLLQRPDGGWAYSSSGKSTQSMTVAGLTCLHIAQQKIDRSNVRQDPDVAKAIEKGYQYLVQNYDVTAKVHGGSSYLWCGYERLAQLSGYRTVGTHAYFDDIATEIINKHAKYDTLMHSAAFDLMFLAQGRRPMWIHKLKINGVEWNNRPNDIYFLNEYVCSYSNAALNWRIVDIDDPIDALSVAPITWLSSDDAISLTDTQVNKLKQYLDNGGILIANNEKQGNRSDYQRSILSLATKMYPDLEFEHLSTDHSFAQRSGRKRSLGGVQILSDGSRPLIVMPRLDWGYSLQAEEKVVAESSEAWYCFLNIYDYLAESNRIKFLSD